MKIKPEFVGAAGIIFVICAVISVVPFAIIRDRENANAKNFREIANKQRQVAPAEPRNIIVNIGEDNDKREVNLRQGDILIIKLRVKENLKKTHSWQDFSKHEALTPLPANEPIYEFSPGHLPGDDNYQLLVYHVNRKVDCGCVLFGYTTKTNGYYRDSLKTVCFHLRERK